MHFNLFAKYRMISVRSCKWQSAGYTAVLDACVLFSRLQRDVLLSLAHADLYTARWTREIETEWTSSLLAKYPDAKDKVPGLVTQMREAIPDCLIVDYEPFIPSIQLPDENDRHVLAAAIRGNADAIVREPLHNPIVIPDNKT